MSLAHSVGCKVALPTGRCCCSGRRRSLHCVKPVQVNLLNSPVKAPWPKAARVRQEQLRRCRAQAATTAAMQPVSDLPKSLLDIVGAFQMVPDPMARYKQLLFFATKLPPMPVEEHTKENKVQGCVSQVWVVAEVKEDGTLQWRADSDSQLTKGLAALLVQGLSGCTPEEVVRVQPDFIEMMGLKQSLTPSRNNGFLNMFNLMQRKAAALLVTTVHTEPAAAETAPPATSQANADTKTEPSASTSSAPSISSSNSSGNGSSSSSSNGAGVPSGTPAADSMRRKLTEALQPTRLDIIDESHQHAGHVGSRIKPGYSGETHFRVEVVSPKFVGLNTVKRHRTIYKLLEEELAGSVHALSLVTKAPEEA